MRRCWRSWRLIRRTATERPRCVRCETTSSPAGKLPAQGQGPCSTGGGRTIRAQPWRPLLEAARKVLSLTEFSARAYSQRGFLCAYAGPQWRACRRRRLLLAAVAAACWATCLSSCCPSSSSCWHTTQTTPPRRWGLGAGAGAGAAASPQQERRRRLEAHRELHAAPQSHVARRCLQAFGFRAICPAICFQRPALLACLALGAAGAAGVCPGGPGGARGGVRPGRHALHALCRHAAGAQGSWEPAQQGV